jgi:hypothetical protein
VPWAGITPLRTEALLIGAAVLAVGAGGCGSGSEKKTTVPSGPTQEYLAAKSVRGFIAAFTDADGTTACRFLTAQRRVDVTARTNQPTCDRAIASEAQATREADLEALGRSRVTKVDLGRARGRAEVSTPGGAGRPAGSHTVSVEKVIGRWKVASDFFPGALERGVVPKAPPGPPRNPAQERRVRATFERFRAALRRGDGRSACSLRTASARRGAVRDAISVDGGRRRALRDFGELTCARVAARVRLPDYKIAKVVVDDDKAELTLSGGATYPFRKVHGDWLLDS